MTLAQLDLGLPHVATFPCNADKTPITQRGFKDAIRGMRWRSAPLVGFPTGAVNGVDVLDIDGPAGAAWYDAHRDRLPLTQTHSTRRGKHFLFHHAAGLRCSESRIAPGVDVKADGGYVVWWPREGFAVEDAEVADWPEWLLEAARAKPRPIRNLSTILSPGEGGSGGGGVKVEGLTEALRQLDPTCWNSKSDGEEKYKAWLALMMACKFAGIEREEFVAWSIGDPDYAGDADVIARKWESFAEPKHAGALWAAPAKAGIKVTLPHNTLSHKENSAEVLHGAMEGSPALPDLRDQSRRLIAWLNAAPSEDRLFRVACVFAERGMRREVALSVLKSNCASLWRSLGDHEFARTIDNAFRHVEENQNVEATA